jgi:hypothetical protein
MILNGIAEDQSNWPILILEYAEVELNAVRNKKLQHIWLKIGNNKSNNNIELVYILLIVVLL